VCPTEIIAFGDRAPEFEALNTQVIAASCDSTFTHLAWENTDRSDGGIGDMKIPILADFNKTVANQYGVLLPDGVPLRALFIIDPKGDLRQITCNDLPVGRNVDEILRLIKAFQFVEVHGEVCPANWQPGDVTMKADPTLSKEYFSQVAKKQKSGDDEAGGLADVDTPEAFAAAIASSGLTVVDFWAPWCQNCKKMTPALTNLTSVIPQAKFIKVNTEVLQQTAVEHGVEAMPTFILFKGGNKVGQFTGTNVAGLQAAIQAQL